MVTNTGRIWNLESSGASLVLSLEEGGIPTLIHYGQRIDDLRGMDSPIWDQNVAIGTMPYLDEEHQRLFPDNMLMQISTPSRGDCRTPSLEVWRGGRPVLLDLRIASVELKGGKDHSFPASALEGEGTETLYVHLKDEVEGIGLTLRYTVYEEEDVILRSMRVENCSNEEVELRKASSLLMDLPEDGFLLYSYDGAWARERIETERMTGPGRIVLGSRLGLSGNEHNPLFFLGKEGQCYGFNLIYSSDHEETIEVSPFGKTRVVSGLSGELFSWTLGPGECFESPEAIMTWASGRQEAASSFRRFTRKYISRGPWRDRPRPVLVNTWEASYFDFDEEGLIALADKAADLGVELFVLDDGWFGHRDDDHSSLGDWDIFNERKFPHGFTSLAKALSHRGLMFGLWVEPECVSPDSRLARLHPEWVLMEKGHKALPCRHQALLDLADKAVQDHLFTVLSKLFSSWPIDYVKWDMNRTLTEVGQRCGGGYAHRYVLGLYSLLGRIRERFPELLIEGCASGGNRYDLGMLCFVDQNWTSDNTDLHDRVLIQEGTLMGYPASTMGAHVSASPAHQTGRVSRIDSRFNIAAFGLLGYELDLNSLTLDEQEAVRRQIAFYKRYREVFQFGTFHKRVVSPNQRWWYVTKQDVTLALEIQCLNETHTGRRDRLVLPWAEKGVLYSVRARRERLEDGTLSEDFHAFVSGDILSTCGLPLGPQFTGNGIYEGVRLLGDFGSRLYIIEKEEER